MKFLKSILSREKREKKLSNNFSFSVKKIIAEIDNINFEISDDHFYKIISTQDLNQFEVDEIYIFLPIAFSHVWLKNVNWDEEYNEILPGETKEISKRYDETHSFVIILEIVKSYFESNPLKNTILQIGGRSAEINAINELLLNVGKEVKIEDIKLTKTTIRR